MRKGPTAEEVQYAIDAKWEDENSYEESRYVPSYASGSIVIHDSRRHIEPSVKQTFVLGDEEDNVYACAIVTINGGGRSYDAGGWQVALLTEEAGLAKRLSGSAIGDELLSGSVIVSINGGPVVTYQEALKEREKRQKLHQLTVAVDGINKKLKQREIRLQNTRKIVKLRQIEGFKDALRNEVQLQEALLFKLQHECETLDQVQRLEQDVLDANKSEEASLGPMRKKAALLCEQEQEQKHKLQQDRLLQQQQVSKILEAADMAAQKKQLAQLAAEVKSRQQLQREQELQEAQRLKQEQIIKQEKAARQKDIDKEAAQVCRSTELLVYEEATNQIESIRHYTQEGASHYIIRERAAHLRSQCMKSRDAVPYASAQATALDGDGTKVGAIIGGIFGIVGGPVGIAFGAVAGGFIGNIADAISQPSPERNRWTRLIDGIDELVSKLPE